MKKKQLGSLTLSALGLGCMGFTGFYGKADSKRCREVIHAAIEQGITFFDTADNYGWGENERLLGSAVHPFRNQAVIATKVGVVRKKEAPQHISINGSPTYIKKSCEESLKRLGITTIDLYYLHHADPNIPIEESIHAMAQLVAEGKVLHIGLGEMATDLIRRAHSVHPITAVQAEYSLFSRDAEKTIIPLCKELDILFIACAPLCRGLLGGMIHSQSNLSSEDARRSLPRFQPDHLKHNVSIVSALQKMAKKRASSLAELALAWISCQSKSITPLFGTTSLDHLQENCKSQAICLSESEILAINELVAMGGVHGARLPEHTQQLYATE